MISWCGAQSCPDGYCKSGVANSDVIKYGAPIGHAIAPIQKLGIMFTHNLKTNFSGTIAYSFNQKLNEIRYAKRDLTLTDTGAKMEMQEFATKFGWFQQWVV
jgi:hypothetical protein